MARMLPELVQRMGTPGAIPSRRRRAHYRQHHFQEIPPAYKSDELYRELKCPPHVRRSSAGAARRDVAGDPG